MSQLDLTLPQDPYITEEMYNVAVSLIQSFDEMEAKDHRLEISMRCIFHYCLKVYSFYLFIPSVSWLEGLTRKSFFHALLVFCEKTTTLHYKLALRNKKQ